MSDLIGTKEAGAILGVDPVTVWRRANKGKLQYFSKVGKQFLFTRSYIERVAREQAQEAKVAA